ncbi:MAG TPA: hypothetical protein VL200_04865 [Lacunisphaera sp.]|nr:hypothetical protein [Lacunisphaera sp.]
MNKKNSLKACLLLAAATLGLAAAAPAAEEPTTPAAAPAGSGGLLGQTYAGLSYSYLRLDSSPVNADRYGFEYNQALNPGFDAVFNYDWTQTGRFGGDRAREQFLSAALRVFSTGWSWGRPYVEAGIGYDWMRLSAGVRDHSFAWIGGAGIEFQAAPNLTVTPFGRYQRLDGYGDKNLFTYGVKANYWLTHQWAVSAQLDRNDSQDMGYKVGFNYRF